MRQLRLAYIFKVKRSKFKFTRPIIAHRHRTPYLPNGKAYELQTRYTDGGRRPNQPQAPWPPRLKIKVVRSRDQSEPCWPNDVPVSLKVGGSIPCRPNPAATFLVLIALSIASLMQ